MKHIEQSRRSSKTEAMRKMAEIALNQGLVVNIVRPDGVQRLEPMCKKHDEVYDRKFNTEDIQFEEVRNQLPPPKSE